MIENVSSGALVPNVVWRPTTHTQKKMWEVMTKKNLMPFPELLNNKLYLEHHSSSQYCVLESLRSMAMKQ